MKKLTLPFLTLTLLFTSSQIFSQQTFDARSAGMAFSNGADTRGLQSVGLNPATLALKYDYRMEFNLISANAAGNNNSFKKSQYDRYFTTGDQLTPEEVDDIFNSIPENGLRVDGIARVNTISFYLPYFSLSLVGMGVALANVPKDVIELPLKGNREPGRIYKFDNAEGGDWAGIGIMASGALPLVQNPNTSMNLFALGATVKYISGLRFDNVVRARGEFRDFDLDNESPFINLNGELEIVSSNGGIGFGADLGALATFNDDKLSIGFTALNVFSNVTWSSQTERMMLSIKGDSLNLPNRVRDSLIVSRDSTVAINSFSTQLPRVLDLAIAYQAAPALLISAEWEQGLNDDMGGTTRARAAFGLEFTGLTAIPLRTGMTFGSKTGTSFAFGMGINLSNWYIDLAYLNHGHIIPGDFKGVGLGLSTRLRF